MSEFRASSRVRKKKAAVDDRPTLLLVDDLPENLFALEETLRRDDMSILTAGSGPEALELLLTHQVALAIIDVQMPEMDGFELASLLRSVERTRHLPIIFVTAGSRDSSRLFKGYEAGAVDFLYKPLDVHVLRGKVEVFMSLERKRRELQASENRFRALAQATSQVVWRVCPDGRGLGDATAWSEFTGQSAADWEAGRWIDMVHPADRKAVLAETKRMTSQRLPFELEYRLRRRDGQFTWTHARIAPVFGASQELLEWIGANSDIEERKRSEQMRELFIAILGHDLRNPLGSVSLGAQLALSRTKDEAVRSPLRRVVDSGARMMRMIDQLLDMTRARSDEPIALQPAEVDLLDLIDRVLDGAPIDRVFFDVAAKGDPVGHWDPDRLFQVLSNLIGNACEHGSDDGPIHVRVDGRAKDRVELRVQNEGPAIPPSIQRVMFEPFRGSTNRKRTARGLGLGLFITKQFVQAHGGTIAIESTDDSGTTFAVTLPR